MYFCRRFHNGRNFENLAGKVSQSAVVKEFAGEFESFVLSTIVRSLTYDPNERK